MSHWRRGRLALGLLAAAAVMPPAASGQAVDVPQLGPLPDEVQTLVDTTRATVRAVVPPAVVEAAPEPVARALEPAAVLEPPAVSRQPSGVSDGGGLATGVAREGTTSSPPRRAAPAPSRPPVAARQPGAEPTGAPARRTSERGNRGRGAPSDAAEDARPPHVAIDLVEVLPAALLALLIALAASALLATGGSVVSEAKARRLGAERVSLLEDSGVLQRALLPDVPERLGPLAVSVGYRPSDGPAAGGDFYDVVPLTGGRVGLILGDVVGHGRAAVAQAALVRHTLRAWLELGLAPSVVLRLTAHGRSRDADDEMATALVAVYDGLEGTLSYSCAGHPEPLLLGPGAVKGFDVPCVSGPLGVDVPTGRRTTTISLPPGTAACLYTDGVVEARTSDGLLGADRFSELLEGAGLDSSADHLLDLVAERAERTPDDMALCILRPIVGSAEPTGQVEELEIAADEIQAAEDFLFDCGVPLKERLTLTAAAAGDALATGRATLRVSWPEAEPHAELVAPAAQPRWLSDALALIR